MDEFSKYVGLDVHKETIQRPKFRRESPETPAFYHLGFAKFLEVEGVQSEINYGVDLRLLSEALDTGEGCPYTNCLKNRSSQV